MEQIKESHLHQEPESDSFTEGPFSVPSKNTNLYIYQSNKRTSLPSTLFETWYLLFTVVYFRLIDWGLPVMETSTFHLLAALCCDETLEPFHPAFMWVLGVQTQLIRLGQQDLYRATCLYSLGIQFLMILKALSVLTTWVVAYTNPQISLTARNLLSRLEEK